MASLGMGGPSAQRGETVDLAVRVAATDVIDLPSPLLRGRYEVLEIVGRGGQGEVVRAWDHHHGRPVALKVRPLAPSTPRERVLDEARTLLELRPHANVPLIRDDFFEGDCHYLVMDWIAGEDLRARLRRDGSPGLPFAVVVEALRDVAAALDHLHSHEPPVVHGDVKPANIIVSNAEDGRARAVLVDFGLAGAVSTEPNTAATEAYASPEVCRGDPATPASDVYSLAATAFELVTGRVAMPGATLDWSAVPPDAIAAVRSCLARGLAVDAAARPASAGALVDALAGDAGDRRSRRAQLSPLARSHPPRRRARLVAAVAVAALGLGGVAGAALDGDGDGDGGESSTEELADPFAPTALPPDVERLGRIGAYFPRPAAPATGAVFETIAVGRGGETARDSFDQGLTESWSTVMPLADDSVLFYRSRDAYLVVVIWQRDGHVVDQYSLDGFGAGYTDFVLAAPGVLLAYDVASGAAKLATFDTGATIVTQVPVTGLPAGATDLVRLADGRILVYDSATGEGRVATVGADGSLALGEATPWGQGWTTLVRVADNTLVLGADGRLQMVRTVADAPEVVDEATTDRWTHAVAPVGEHVALYDAETGAGRLVATTPNGLVIGAPITAEPGAAFLVGQP